MTEITKIIKEITAYIINFSCLPKIIRYFIARKKMTILLYHNPKKKSFEQHLKYLSSKYNFIKLETLIDGINKKKWDKIPEYPLIITFDDGHKNNFQLIEICKKYKINPTIYVCTKIVNSFRGFWFNFVQDSEKDFIKKFSEEKRQKILVEKYKFLKNKKLNLNNRQSLNKMEMNKMKNVFDFQSHSQYHSILTTCSDKQCFRDIKKSRTDLQNIFRSPFKHFSYPNGDYSQREISYLNRTNYASGRTCDIGWNDLNSDTYKLKICLISDNVSLNMLKAQVSGITGYLRYLTKGSFNGKKKINYI